MQNLKNFFIAFGVGFVLFGLFALAIPKMIFGGDDNKLPENNNNNEQSVQTGVQLGDKEEAIITFIIKKRWMDSMTASSAQYFAIKISPDCKQYIADDGCCYDYYVTRLMCITKPDAVSKLKELESVKISLDEFDQDIF